MSPDVLRLLIPPSVLSVLLSLVHAVLNASLAVVLQADQRGILQVPGWEWAVFRLGQAGLIRHIEVDTNHFKGGDAS